MAEAPKNAELCTICQEDDILNNASVWCFECDDFLCGDCSRVHSRSKSLKEHKVTTLEDYKNLPEVILDIKNRCSEHDEKCEFYCSFHGNACCVKCIKDSHKECRELKPLREVLNNFKSSAAVSNLEQDLQKLEKDFDKVATYLESRRNKNQEQGSAILKEVHRIRSELNDHLDKIEKKIVDELESEQTCIDGKLEKLVSQIQERKHAIVTIRDDFSKMNRHATEFQSYMGSKKIESISNEEANFLANLVDNEPALNETNMEMELSAALKTLVHDVAAFGKIVVRSSKNVKDIGVLREQNAQLSVGTTQAIDDIKLSRECTIDVSAELIYGCIILSDEKFAFADCDTSSVIFYERGSYIKKINLSSFPASLALVKNNQVAITLPTLHVIKFVDVEKNQIVKEITTEGECWDIHVEDEKLFVRIYSTDAVHVLDLNRDASVTQKITIPGFYLLNISFFSGLIYCTNWKENTVYCYTMEGQLKWTFKHDDLREPRGITIDGCGFIYVVCRESNKLMVISPDGKNGKALLDTKDGIQSPEAISINKSHILISSKNKALLFHI